MSRDTIPHLMGRISRGSFTVRRRASVSVAAGYASFRLLARRQNPGDLLREIRRG